MGIGDWQNGYNFIHKYLTHTKIDIPIKYKNHSSNTIPVKIYR